MNAIVLNTLTGAVSEYTGFDFHAITPTHAGSALGLYALGGDLDLAAPIVGRFALGATQQGDSLKKRLDGAYFSCAEGAGAAQLTVAGKQASFTYDFPLRAGGVSRCPVGKGLRENYFAFTFIKPDGLAFTIDKFEVMSATSNTRRI